MEKEVIKEEQEQGIISIQNREQGIGVFDIDKHT